MMRALTVFGGIFLGSLLLSGCSEIRANTTDAHRPAKDAILKYGCNTCHTIPGVPGARGNVGPSLAQFGGRATIAGEIPHTTDNVAAWIQHPRTLRPHTVMPEMGVTEQDARTIVDYLESLK